MFASDDGAPAGNAQLLWDENGQPISARYDDVYFSKNNGLAESRYVFLEQNRLAERWRAGFAEETFYIGETGFGTGLNFLAAWQLWNKSPSRHKRLHFVSVENEPLHRADLQRALALWPELSDQSRALLAVYPQRIMPGFHRFSFAGGRVVLTLIVADASAGLNQLLMSDHPQHRLPFHRGMQAWFLDGFAPAKNPSMWQPALFDAIAALSGTACTLATFTAAGLVRRELQRVGFRVRKRPGYGSKRDMLAAEFAGTQVKASHHLPTSVRTSPYPLPWHVRRQTYSEARHCREAVVIGAGLAGSHTARALAERGWRIKVFDEAVKVADGASGNAQGVVYGKLSGHQDLLSSFNLASLLFAQRHYSHYWQSVPEVGEQCGVLMLAFNANERRLQEKLQAQLPGGDFVRSVDCQQASELAGLRVEHPALFFPQLGWMRPARLCRSLLDHPNIDVTCRSRVDSLRFDAQACRWDLFTDQGQKLATAPAVVIANACKARSFSFTSHLALKAIRGQVSYFAGETLPLRTVVCGDGYIAPADKSGAQDLQSFGATFTLQENRPEVLARDHQQNLAKLRGLLPDALQSDGVHIENLNGRAAFRCTTPDYLPLVGPVADFEGFVESYRLLGKNARAGIHTAGPYLQGLYLNVGHGSRGLAYTPLSAALLAATMDQDVLPVSRELATALNPARFIVRDLIRRRLPPDEKRKQRDAG